MTEHFVFMVLSRERATDDMLDEIRNLGDKAAMKLTGVISHEVVMSLQEDSENIGVVSHWIFEDDKALETFRESSLHRAHLSRVMPSVLMKHVWNSVKL